MLGLPPFMALDRSDRVVVLVLAALLVVGTVAYALAVDDRGRSTTDLHADAPYYYVYLPSLVLDGDLDFRDEYRETKNWYRFGTTPTGRAGNVFGIGPAIMQAPLFVVAHGAAIANGDRRDGFSAWEVRSFTWSALPLSLAAVWLAYRVARRRVTTAAPALIGALAAFLAGPVVYYAVHQPGYAHPHAAFWVAFLVERWDASFRDRGPRSLATWLGLGALLGAAALARPQLATWGLLLVPAVVDDLRRRSALPGWRWRLPLRWAAGAALALVVLAPQLAAWKVLYGAYYAVPQGPGFMRWDAPCWTEVLFSSRNGLLPWSPAYLLFAIGLALAIPRAPRLAIGLGAGVLAQAIVSGAAWDWWAGGSFGGRRFDSAYVAFAIGAAALVALMTRSIAAARGGWRSRIAGAAAVGVAAVLALAIAANLHLAARISVTSARITGGEPAPDVLRASLRGPHGRVAALLSSVATLPARAAFAWRHGVGLDAYDRIVGVHALGDTYPGLNSYGDKRSDTVPLTGRAPRLIGFAAAPGTPPGHARLRGDRARVLIGLNRTGTVTVGLRLAGTGAATVRWNGAVVATAALGPDTRVAFTTADLVRGANELAIEAPAGTSVAPVELSASPPAR
jgi:hypothetical protein